MARTAYSKDEFPSNAVRSTFDATTGAGATSFNVSPATNWPSSNFWVVANRTGDNSSKEELMYVETNNSGALTNVNRAQGGTSAAEHEAGDPIEVVWPGVAADEVSQLVSETLGAISSAGDLVRASDSDTLARLPAGSNDDVLRVAGGTPSFGAIPAGAVGATQLGAEAVTAAKFDDTDDPLTRKFRVVSQAEEDALDATLTLRHGDELVRTDLGDNGIKKEWNGTAWVPVSGQVIQTVTSGAVSTLTVDGFPTGLFSALRLELDVESSNANVTLRGRINNKSGSADYRGALTSIGQGATSVAVDHTAGTTDFRFGVITGVGNVERAVADIGLADDADAGAGGGGDKPRPVSTTFDRTGSTTSATYRGAYRETAGATAVVSSIEVLPGAGTITVHSGRLIGLL